MASIVVVGSVARDEVVRLEERLREGGHLQGSPLESRLGGGGANSAVALAHAGHRVSLVAAVGDDALADRLLAELEEARVDTGAVVRVAGASTRSLVLLDRLGERTIVNLSRAREALPPHRLLDLAADCIYVRSGSTGLAPLLAEKAKSCPIIAHVPPLREGDLPAHVLVGSQSDLDAAVLADPLAAARPVAGGLLRWMVVTRGAAGAEAFGTSGEHLTLPAPRVEAVDSTGAGDAFAAGLAHALAGGAELPAALGVAIAWGSAKVACPGSALTKAVVGMMLCAGGKAPL
jgi:sugar/nucleoside kinase (ribokinase family)